MNPALLNISDSERNEVVVLKSASPKLLINASVQSMVDETWNRLIALNPNLYEAGLVRCVGVTHDAHSVMIETATDITYKDIVGLRNAQEFSEILSKGVPFQALSAIAFVYTRDGSLLLIERCTGDWPHSLELPGAFMRPKIQDEGLYQSVLDFLHTDLNVSKEHVQHHSLLGVLDYPSICEMMLLLKINLNISFEEVQKASPKKVFSIPKHYATETHDAFFTLPLHTPTRTVLDTQMST